MGIAIQEESEEMPDLKDLQVQDATLKIQSAYRGFKTRKELKESGEDLPDLKAKDVVAATIKIQAAYKGFRTRQMVAKHKEVMPDLNCAQVQDATIKIQSAYRGFKTRKEINSHPELKATVGATLKIQAYYRGFKVRKALRDQEARQEQARADVAEAAMKLRVLPTDRSKKLLKNTPKTPMQSFDLPSSPQVRVGSSSSQPVKSSQLTRPQRPQRPSVAPVFPSNGQRIKKSVPKFVDERDSKRISRKPLGQAPESVQEDRTREFVHHPADVVCAAMTIQRFFKTVKAKKEVAKKEQAKKEAAKRTKSYDSTTTESSADDSSNYDPSQSDSSESDTQQRRKQDSSSESSDTE